MKLYEALKFGITLRPESHQERFCNVEGRGLTSDAWGAICEAVQPAVAKFNWDTKDKAKFESAIDAFRAVQLHYFKDYFDPERYPAQCPGAKDRSFGIASRTILNVQGRYMDRETGSQSVGAITSECQMVNHLAGMVDHLFYAHNWSREQVLEVIQWYEETKSTAALVVNFTHFQNESLRQKISQQVNIAARQRERERHQQRAGRRRIFGNGGI